jgi:hypothetical protein
MQTSSSSGLFRQVFGACCAILAFVLLPAAAHAQFFPFFDFQPRRAPQQQFRFGPLFGPPARVQQEAPRVDFSRAPSPKKSDATPATKIVVMGDSMADWLAYGLEEAFSETPEIGIVRKHRTTSGLLRYESRSETTWAQVAREVIAAEKPAFVLMMLGLNDRAAIRERQAAAAGSKRGPSAGSTEQAPEAQAERPSEDKPNDPQAADPDDAESPAAAPEPARGATTALEFRSERWVAAYTRRVSDTMAALKSAGVPVIWVGLPPLRGTRSASDMQFLNQIYKSAAERADVTFVDVWDAFTDESGKFSLRGPDYEGQTRQLRTTDGVHFTRAGARTLAHFVEREIRRLMGNRSVPVALPAPETETPGPSASLTPGAPPPRPLVGPVLPLTLTSGGHEELAGGTGAHAPSADAVAIGVLTRGEPLTPPAGRADDFTWPRAAMIETRPGADPVIATPAEAAPATPAVVRRPAAVSRAAGAESPSRSRAAAQDQRSASQADRVPRPPAPLGGLFSGGGLFGLFR